MGSKVVIACQNHLCRTPRVLKEALALDEARYEVIILASVHSAKLLEEDVELLKGSSIRYSFYANAIKRNLQYVGLKIVQKLSLILLKRLGVESIHNLGIGANALLKHCFFEKADLYIMHQELPLLVGETLIKKGLNVAFDIEDFYSEDLLPAARRQRPNVLLKKAEAFALNNGIYTTTTSCAMSNHLFRAYGGSKPKVIRNVFSLPNFENWSEIMDHKPRRIYWFSQTIGPGRGLELLVSAANLLSVPLEIHLRGKSNPSYIDLLEKNLNSIHKLIVHPMLRNAQLVADMEQYDVGVALEPMEPLNKLLTSSNKIFHYLTGGLPVIASDTLGQREIFELQSDDRRAVFLFENNSAEALAQQLNLLLFKKGDELKNIKKRALLLAQEKFNWEVEKLKVIELVGTSILNSF